MPRCDRCGQETAAGRRCSDCGPGSPPLVVQGLARLATVGLGAVALVAAALNSTD